MKIKISLTIFIYLIINNLSVYCQADKDIFSRIQAINNNGFVFGEFNFQMQFSYFLDIRLVLEN
jgi:hypothetical protein